MASVSSLHALLIDELKDLYHAESQLVNALPKMGGVATDADRKAGSSDYLQQTRGHVDRLKPALATLGLPSKGKTGHAMMGSVEEGGEAIATEGPAAVRDAALLGAAQRIEHYEMAGCDTARAFAPALRENHITELLQGSLGVNESAREASGQIPAGKNSPVNPQLPPSL